MEKAILVNGPRKSQDELTISKDLKATGNDCKAVDRHWG